MTDEKALEKVKAPLPVFTTEQMIEAVTTYKKLQATLDRVLKDQVIKIQNKDFRKKGYWRAIRIAFNLRVDLIKEERIGLEKDWGFEVIYRATAPNGSYNDGDGACYASEKYANQATVHNVRAHAHTRAKNRAISDLVGFGEVSAEEMEQDFQPSRQEQQKVTQQKADAQAKQNGFSISKLYAAALDAGMDEQTWKALVATLGITSNKNTQTARRLSLIHDEITKLKNSVPPQNAGDAWESPTYFEKDNPEIGE